ncbi:MAG: hypothetical protein ABF468_09115 [Acetobacter fabarum]
MLLSGSVLPAVDDASVWSLIGHEYQFGEQRGQRSSAMQMSVSHLFMTHIGHSAPHNGQITVTLASCFVLGLDGLN